MASRMLMWVNDSAALGLLVPTKPCVGGGRLKHMRPTIVEFFALACAALIAAPAVAQESGNTDAGRRLAENWCGKCHVVAPRSIRSGDAASSFQAIANLEFTTALSLKVFLRTSHQDMPNFQLTPEETDDIIAYVLSLKTK